MCGNLARSPPADRAVTGTAAQSREYAGFVVVKDSGTYSTRWLRAAAERTFGPPQQTYVVGPYTIMTWPANLLTRIGPDRG